MVREQSLTCLKDPWGAAVAPVSSRYSSQLNSISSTLEPASGRKIKCLLFSNLLFKFSGTKNYSKPHFSSKLLTTQVCTDLQLCI